MLATRQTFLLFAFTTLVASSAFGQAIYLTGVGPVNRSMGGAGTAAPLDAIGALNWNPASISGLGNELGFGIELLLADIDLASNLGGQTSGEPGIAPAPTVGWVHHLEGTPMTIGLGLEAVAGFKNIQPAGNPLLMGQPGSASAQFLQLTPTIAYAINDQLAVGIAPMITLGELSFDPLGPSAINPLLGARGMTNRMHWGGGVQAGVYYIGNNDVHLGFTIKSPVWFEDFRFHSPDAHGPGMPGVNKFKLDLPMILSLGFAYTGCEDWTLACDVRYFGFDDADGFSELGYGNIFAAAFGAQRVVNDRVTVRLGANFNQDPLHASDFALNVLSPLNQTYNLSAGGSYRLSDAVDVHMAYVYLGNTLVSGPVPVPGVPGIVGTNEIEAHSAIMGASVHY